MSTYKADKIKVKRNSAEIADKFADLTALEEMKSQLPQDTVAQLGSLSFEKDAIVVDTAQLGKVRFVCTRRDPQGVKFEAQGMPVPLDVNVALDPKGDTETDVTTSVDVEIPMMMRPFIAPQMNKMVNSLAQVIAKMAER